MPIFATPRFDNDDDLKIMHELEVKQNDSGNDDDSDQDQDSGGSPSDAPEDYTLDDEGEDQTPEEGEDNPPEEGTEANNQADDGDDSFGGGGDDMGSGDDGDDMGGGGEGGGGEGEDGDDSFGDDDGGGEGGDDDDNDDYTSDSDSGDKDELKAIEDELFANYTPEQRAIMAKALKKRFYNIIDMSADLTDRINEIPKAMEHIKAIEFVTDKLDEIQRMVADYLYYTFDTKTYPENEKFFQQLMITYNQIDQLVGKIPSITTSKPAT